MAYQIIRAEFVETGGNCYMYIGELADGRFFVASELVEDEILFLDADYWENWEEADDDEWLVEHTVGTLCGDDAFRFWGEIFENVTGISEYLLQAEKEWLAEKFAERGMTK